MLKDNEFWILVAAGALALVLAGINMYLYTTNRTLQVEANGRAQYIQQSIALETLYRQIVRELADRAVRTRDDEIRAMLAAEGLDLTFEAPPATDATGGAQR